VAHRDGAARVVVNFTANFQTGYPQALRVAARVYQVVKEGLDVDGTVEAAADIAGGSIARSELVVAPLPVGPVVSLMAQGVLLVASLHAGPVVVAETVLIAVAWPAFVLPAPPRHQFGVHAGIGIGNWVAFAEPELHDDIPGGLILQLDVQVVDADA